MGSIDYNGDSKTPSGSDQPSSGELARQTPEELEEERRKIRRLQIVINMVTQVIAQDTTVTLDEASEMDGGYATAGAWHVPGQGTGVQFDLLAAYAATDAGAVSDAVGCACSPCATRMPGSSLFIVFSFLVTPQKTMPTRFPAT